MIVKPVPERLRTTRAELVTLPQVSLSALRNREQNRFTIDPALQALYAALHRGPDALCVTRLHIQH